MFGRVVLLLLFQCAECALTSQAIGHLRGGAAPEEAARKEAVPKEAVRKEAAPAEAVPEEAEEAVPEEALPEDEEALPEDEEAVPALKKLSKAEARELLDSAVKILTDPANKQQLQETADDAWAITDAGEREAMLAEEVLPVAQSMMMECFETAGFEESDMMAAIDQIQAHAKEDGKMTEELNKLQKAMKGGDEQDHAAKIYDVTHVEFDDYFGNTSGYAEVNTPVEDEQDDFVNETADEGPDDDLSKTEADEVSTLAEGENDNLANATADEVNKPVEGKDDDLAKSNAK